MKNNILQIYHYILSLFWGEDLIQQSFRGALGKSNNVLIIVPIDLAAAVELIPCIKSLADAGKRITILIYHDIRYKFPNDHRLKYEEYFKSDLILERYPKFSFLQRLRKLRFDLVVDLDLDGNNFTSLCILAVHSPYKAGISRKYFERAYNIRFQKKEDQKLTIAQNYVDLLNGL